MTVDDRISAGIKAIDIAVKVNFFIIAAGCLCFISFLLFLGCAHRPPTPIQPPNQYPGPGHKTVQRPSSNYAHPGSVEWIKERKREAGL